MNGVERWQVGEKLPKGWKWVKLEDICKIVGGSTLPEHSESKEDQRVYCIKVSDLDGNFSDGKTLSGSPLHTDRHLAGGRILASGAIVFPKRGGAIATNKKRILGISAVLDPSLMGVEANISLILPIFFTLLA